MACLGDVNRILTSLPEEARKENGARTERFPKFIEFSVEP